MRIFLVIVIVIVNYPTLLGTHYVVYCVLRLPCFSARYTLPVFTVRKHGCPKWHSYLRAVNADSVYRA